MKIIAMKLRYWHLNCLAIENRRNECHQSFKCRCEDAEVFPNHLNTFINSSQLMWPDEENDKDICPSFWWWCLSRIKMYEIFDLMSSNKLHLQQWCLCWTLCNWSHLEHDWTDFCIKIKTFIKTSNVIEHTEN